MPLHPTTEGYYGTMKSKSTDLLTMPEAGEELHCTASQVRKLVRDGVLAGEKCCFKTLRLRRNSLEMLAEDGNVSLLRIRATTAVQLHALAAAKGESADDLADQLLQGALANELEDDTLPAVELPQMHSTDALAVKQPAEKAVRKRKKKKGK